MFGWRLAAVAAAALCFMGAASAAYVVDTGPGQAGAPAFDLSSLGGSYQHLGTGFNLAQDSSITSVEGWIGGRGRLVFELHQGATPNGALLFSQLVDITDGHDDWRGAIGLDWDLLAGDYTLAVIAQPGFNGQMSTSPPRPLGPTWFANPLRPNWDSTSLSAGWRIGAEATAAPEPASLALVALALALLGSSARRGAAG